VIKNVDNGTVTAQISYLEIVYYGKVDPGKPGEREPAVKTPASQYNYTSAPLANATIYFFFEGRNVSLDGAKAGCNPVLTGAKGYANCTIAYYYNGSAFRSIENRGSCGTGTAAFPGGYVMVNGLRDKEFKPSSENFLICPKENSAISVLGPSLMKSISSTDNLPFCFPAIIIAGLLISAMYYNGRDPLSLFDLTTPRLPKTKQGRISGGSTAMGIRTAVSRYVEAQKKSKRNMEKILGKIAGPSRKSDAKKALKAFFKKLDDDLKEYINNTDMSYEQMTGMIGKHNGELLKIFREYGLDRKDERLRSAKTLRKYYEMVGDSFHVYYTSQVAMNLMQSSRSPYNGKLFSAINTKLQGATKKLEVMERAFLRVPGARLLSHVPLVGLVIATPRKIVDYVAQYRSAKGWGKVIQRTTWGYVFYRMGTHEDAKTGERTKNAFGKAFSVVMGEKSPLGKYAKWNTKWTVDKFFDRHNLREKKIGHLRDEPGGYSEYLRTAFGIASTFPFALINGEDTVNALKEGERRQLLRAAKDKASEKYSLDHLSKALEDSLKSDEKKIHEIRNNNALSHTAQEAQIDAIHANGAKERAELINGCKVNAALLFKPGAGANADEVARLKAQENLYKEFLAVSQAHLENKDKSLAEHLGAVLKAKGVATAEITELIGRIGEHESELQKLGIVRKDAEYTQFSKELLHNMALAALDALYQSDQTIKASRGTMSVADIAKKVGLSEADVDTRIKWLSNKENIKGGMDSFSADQEVRLLAAKRLARKIEDMGFAKCEALGEFFDPAKKGRGGAIRSDELALELLSIGDGRGRNSKGKWEFREEDADKKVRILMDSTAAYNARIGNRFEDELIRQMELEKPEKAGGREKRGVLSSSAEDFQALNRAIAKELKLPGEFGALAPGSDPGGAVAAYFIGKICAEMNVDLGGKQLFVSEANEASFRKELVDRGLLQHRDAEIAELVRLGAGEGKTLSDNGRILRVEKKEGKLILLETKLNNLNDLELLFAHGPNSAKTYAAVTAAFKLKISSEGADSAAKCAVDVLALSGTDSIKRAELASIVQKRLLAIVENRELLAARISELRDNPKGYEKLAKLLDLSNEYRSIGVSGGHTRESFEGLMLERMHLLSSTETTGVHRVFGPSSQISIARRLLGGNLGDHVFSNSSFAEFVYASAIAKTENTLAKWGGGLLRAGEMLNPMPEVRNSVSKWLIPSAADARDEFKKVCNVSQQIEYAAYRRSLGYNQYQGEAALDIETMLYISRGMSHGAEFVISRYMPGANAVGSLLGAFDTQFNVMVKSYAMQRALYRNLVDENSCIHDTAFIKKVSDAGGTADKFDGTASLALKERGFLFKDARHVPYILSSDNKGVIPVLEYDAAQLADYRDGRARSVILKASKDPNDSKINRSVHDKEDMRDYGPLLANLNVSDFGSEVIGVCVVKNKNTGADADANPKYVRYNPSKDPAVQQLMSASKLDVTNRTNLANVVVGVGVNGLRSEKPLVHFVSSNDYVQHHVGAAGRAYQKFMEKTVGEPFHDIFYNDVIRLRSWFAAQARARQAIEKMGQHEDWMVAGKDRLQSGKFFEKIKEDDDARFRNALERMDAAREATREAAKGTVAEIAQNKERFQDLLKRTVAELQDKDKSSTFARSMYAKIEKEAGDYQSAAYGAKLTLEALKEIHRGGAIHGVEQERGYQELLKLAKQKERDFAEGYRVFKKDREEFTQAVISMTGSHDFAGYYGSMRNIFVMNPMTQLVPFLRDFRYEQSYSLGFGMSIESMAMRGGEYNRGGRLGAEAFEKMNMNTGQGIYENPRWWASSLYEQQMVLPMIPTYLVHKMLLPHAAHAYRRMIGLSSFLQRTEKETEWGKSHPTDFISFFGLKRGVNDIFSATVQVSLDYLGLSSALAAARKGGSVTVLSDGTVLSERGKLAKWLDRVGVTSGHVGADTQIINQNRLRDRIDTISSEYGDKVVNDGSGVLRVHKETGAIITDTEYKTDTFRYNADTTRELTVNDLRVNFAVLQMQYENTNDARERESIQMDIDRYEHWFKPYDTVALKDWRQEVNKSSEGGGHYFMIDGSRDRPMNLFVGDHVNTWQQVIPGMTESGPFMNKTLSTTTVNYFEHWGSTYSGIGQARSLALSKHGYYHAYDEDSDTYSLRCSYDTRHDAYRDVFKMETPAIMQIMKMQTFEMQYAGFEPFKGLAKGLPIISWIRKIHGSEQKRMNMALSEAQRDSHLDAQLALYGIGDSGSSGMNVLAEADRFKYQNYHKISRRAKFRMLDGIYEHYVHRSDIIALQQTEAARNMREFRYQMLLLRI